MNLNGKAAYKPVQQQQGEDDRETEEEIFQDEPSSEVIAQSTRSRIEPLELGSISSGEDDEGLPVQEGNFIFWIHLTLLVTFGLVVPSLVIGITLAYKLTGRMWTCSLFSLHLTLALMKAYCHVLELAPTKNTDTNRAEIETTRIPAYQDEDGDHDNQQDNTEDIPPSSQQPHNIDSAWEHPEMTFEIQQPKAPNSSYHYFSLTSIPSALDILLFGFLYRAIIVGIHDVVFFDADGEPVVDWTRYYQGFRFILVTGYIIAVARFLIGTRMILAKSTQFTYYQTTLFYVLQGVPVLGSCLQCFYRFWMKIRSFLSPSRPSTLKSIACWTRLMKVILGCSFLLLLWSFYSLIVHFGPFEPWFPHNDPNVCDPLDKSECCLPFPSFYHLQRDNSTETGYRVNLKPETFPVLKGRIPIPVDFLNTLDGFGTMGPMLFYVEGMKESHEEYIQALQGDKDLRTKVGFARLRGHEELELSTTPYSTTLLIDVAEQELVPHSAEIDYLDPKRPLVMVFPAQPLKHNAQYAVAVINAKDSNGKRLPPNPGLLELLDGEGPSERKELFHSVLLPALQEATRKADWGGPEGAYVRNHDPEALQLLFDYQTASKKSQLGNARAVRDHTLQYIEDHWKDKWQDHVRVVKVDEGDCLDQGYPLARTIHGELDVPWYMRGFGPGYRDTTLNPRAVASGVPTTIGKAKFLVKVPCSLRAAVAPIPNSPSSSRDLRLVLEFGHGLFGNREEIADDFLIKMADRGGYILMAMDWRGMSQYDFPVIARTMLSDPQLFESVRDNLIQGYANKYALQHFSQNGMLDMAWLKFKDIDDKLQKIPRVSELSEDGSRKENVRNAFYGISQGGILGAGYLGLSGKTGLIPQGVLGVPGSPFSLILSRSLDFLDYDTALLLNFYSNRHVRIFLSLAQLCWDSVEGSGVLGQPIEEPLPSILIQAGLGDPIVPTLAAERLARAIHAKIFPDNPRHVWTPPGYNATVREDTAFTEMLYKREYNGLPKDDRLKKDGSNDVHICVRLEPVLQGQIEEFLSHQNITDPCSLHDGTACIKEQGDCFRKHKDATD